MSDINYSDGRNIATNREQAINARNRGVQRINDSLQLPPGNPRSYGTRMLATAQNLCPEFVAEDVLNGMSFSTDVARGECLASLRRLSQHSDGTSTTARNLTTPNQITPTPVNFESVQRTFLSMCRKWVELVSRNLPWRLSEDIKHIFVWTWTATIILLVIRIVNGRPLIYVFFRKGLITELGTAFDSDFVDSLIGIAFLFLPLVFVLLARLHQG
eukprot:Filipodium_phascolosomae@DN1992_c0_g1_i1.p1